MSCSCWFFLVSYNKSDSELFPVTSVLPRQHQLEPLVSSPLGVARDGVGPARRGSQEPVLVCATAKLPLSPFLGPRQGCRSAVVGVRGQGLRWGGQRGWDSSVHWMRGGGEKPLWSLPLENIMAILALW